MSSSPEEPPRSNPTPDAAPAPDELATALQDVERSLAEFKTRYHQVKRDQHQLAQLQQAHADRVAQLPQSTTPELKAELDQLQTQIDELEFALESRLFRWASLKEPFWQIVRFGGLGLLLGWLLATTTAPPQPPQPSPPTSPNRQL